MRAGPGVQLAPQEGLLQRRRRRRPGRPARRSQVLPTVPRHRPGLPRGGPEPHRRAAERGQGGGRAPRLRELPREEPEGLGHGQQLRGRARGGGPLRRSGGSDPQAALRGPEEHAGLQDPRPDLLPAGQLPHEPGGFGRGAEDHEGRRRHPQQHGAGVPQAEQGSRGRRGLQGGAQARPEEPRGQHEPRAHRGEGGRLGARREELHDGAGGPARSGRGQGRDGDRQPRQPRARHRPGDLRGDPQGRQVQRDGPAEQGRGPVHVQGREQGRHEDLQGLPDVPPGHRRRRPHRGCGVRDRRSRGAPPPDRGDGASARRARAQGQGDEAAAREDDRARSEGLREVRRGRAGPVLVRAAPHPDRGDAVRARVRGLLLHGGAEDLLRRVHRLVLRVRAREARRRVDVRGRHRDAEARGGGGRRGHRRG